jgi:hypothetical protein
MLTRCPDGHLFSSRRYGNICPYCSKVVVLGKGDRKSEDSEDNYNDSMPYVGDLEVMNPVTGWIICIEGPSKGRDYRVLMEKNFIGRSDGMDIQILGDNSIAKHNHAIIVYDPKKRQTILLPGDAQGLVYVNDEAIYAPVELHGYDVIELGKSKFLFVPLCGEHFEWQDTENKKDKLDEKV